MYTLKLSIPFPLFFREWMSVTLKKKPSVFLSIGCGRRYHVCQRRSHRAKEALISKSPRVERTGMALVEADLVMTSQPGARTGPSLRVLRGWSGVSVCGGAVMRRSLTALTAQLTCKQWAAVNHGNITSLPTCSPPASTKEDAALWDEQNRRTPCLQLCFIWLPYERAPG